MKYVIPVHNVSISYYILQLSTCKPLSGSSLHRLVIDWSFECHLIILAKFFTNTGRADTKSKKETHLYSYAPFIMYLFCMKYICNFRNNYFNTGSSLHHVRSKVKRQTIKVDFFQ